MESPASEEKAKPARRATAETMALAQRDISVSEFFTKNRHLLGFDNPAKALLTTVKEAVDNSLDACEEAGILPELIVEIVEVAAGAGADQPSRFRVVVEDNGPGIVKPQIPKIFAKLLYGSKFHRLKQSRGQQGIGISAAGLYGQLTTGKPVVITSKTGKGRPAFQIELRIDTKRNQPDVVKDETVEWDKEHGTRVEIELVAAYRGGRTGRAGVPGADGRREPAPGAHVRAAQGRARSSSRACRASCRARRRRSSRTRTASSSGCCRRCWRTRRARRVKQVLVRRLLARVARASRSRSARSRR